MIILPTEKRFNWNNPPLVLLFIILANIFIYFSYQSSDDKNLNEAYDIYANNDFNTLEWPLFEQYSKANKSFKQQVKIKALYHDKEVGKLSWLMLSDKKFYDFAQQHINSVLSADKVPHWIQQRKKIQQLLDDTSTGSFALVPSELNLLTLLSHQFLHGGLIHLMGNMFFLIICGFAVEAAIGHWRFLAFYLITGVAGGLAHSLLDLTSTTPLVGASGAISGVMAMYLGVFRLQKIEFFYWFFIFVGYFRAPALLILPFYIAKELYEYNNAMGNQVAYMAHVGGFIAGALLMALLVLLKKDLLNEKYIEEDQSIDPSLQLQDAIFTALEGFRFKKTITLLEQALAENKKHLSNQLLLAQLKLLLKEDQAKEFALTTILDKKANKVELIKQGQLYSELAAQYDISINDQLDIGIKLCALEDISLAENIFSNLNKTKITEPRMNIFAGKLSFYYQHNQNSKRREFYEDFINTNVDAQINIAGNT